MREGNAPQEALAVSVLVVAARQVSIRRATETHTRATFLPQLIIEFFCHRRVFCNVCIVGSCAAGYKRAGGNELAERASEVWPAYSLPIT